MFPYNLSLHHLLVYLQLKIAQSVSWTVFYTSTVENWSLIRSCKRILYHSFLVTYRLSFRELFFHHHRITLLNTISSLLICYATSHDAISNTRVLLAFFPPLFFPFASKKFSHCTPYPIEKQKQKCNNIKRVCKVSHLSDYR